MCSYYFAISVDTFEDSRSKSCLQTEKTKRIIVKLIEISLKPNSSRVVAVQYHFLLEFHSWHYFPRIFPSQPRPMKRSRFRGTLTIILNTAHTHTRPVRSNLVLVISITTSGFVGHKVRTGPFRCLPRVYRVRTHPHGFVAPKLCGIYCREFPGQLVSGTRSGWDTSCLVVATPADFNRFSCARHWRCKGNNKDASVPPPTQPRA